LRQFGLKRLKDYVKIRLNRRLEHQPAWMLQVAGACCVGRSDFICVVSATDEGAQRRGIRLQASSRVNHFY
jgi:hypothetical protein